jgi:hypothetical protein
MYHSLLWLAAAICFAVPGPVHAQPDLVVYNTGAAAEKIAQKVIETVGTSTPVFVREFRGIGESNVGLAASVVDELKEARVSVDRGAAVEVEGRVVRLPIDPARKLMGYTIRCTVVLADGSEHVFSVDVRNPDEGEIAVGKTGETAAPPNKPEGSKPTVNPIIDGTLIRPAADSPYGVEVLVERRNDVDERMTSSGPKPLQKGITVGGLPGIYDAVVPEIVDGSVRVKLQRGDLIAYRLYNSGDHDAAAKTLVDGLSRFALSDDPNRKGGLDLVPAKGRREIIGYYRNSQLVDAFQIGSYSESPAANLLPQASAIGTVTIVFHAAWILGEGSPNNEPPNRKNIAINSGPPREDPTEQIQRNIGGVRAVVKIFYGE